MSNIKDVLVKESDTIFDVIQIIDKSSKQLAIVVDEHDKLLGTISDGDIRRAILKNMSLDETIKEIYFKNPTVCRVDSSKEEMLSIAVEKKLHQIPIVDEDGKLVGIEEIENLVELNKKTNKVILMVGGLGSRLRPLTNNTPKPMLKVGGKPILETIIQNFKKYGFVNIILCVSYKSHIIEDYFGDGSEFGVNIKYIHENKRMGTAGALSLIDEKINEPFFVMNGDLLTNINFEHMMDYHIQNKSDATMGVREYDFQVPYGVVNVHGIDIKNIEEKPVHNFYVSGGVYTISPNVLKYIPKDEFFDMPTLFEILIKDKGKAISFPIREYWLDIGRVEEFKKANEEYHKVF